MLTGGEVVEGFGCAAVSSVWELPLVEDARRSRKLARLFATLVEDVHRCGASVKTIDLVIVVLSGGDVAEPDWVL